MGNRIKKHVEEKSRLGKKCQREKPQAESFLFWNLLGFRSAGGNNSGILVCIFSGVPVQHR